MLDFSRQNQHIALYRALRQMTAPEVIQVRNRALLLGRRRVADACTAEMISQHGWTDAEWSRNRVPARRPLPPARLRRRSAKVRCPDCDRASTQHQIEKNGCCGTCMKKWRAGRYF